MTIPPDVIVLWPIVLFFSCAFFIMTLTSLLSSNVQRIPLLAVSFYFFPCLRTIWMRSIFLKRISVSLCTEFVSLGPVLSSSSTRKPARGERRSKISNRQFKTKYWRCPVRERQPVCSKLGFLLCSSVKETRMKWVCSFL